MNIQVTTVKFNQNLPSKIPYTEHKRSYTNSKILFCFWDQINFTNKQKLILSNWQKRYKI